MKKILLLTDFSANAAHAGTIAFELSTILQTDLLLYHSYHLLPVTPYYASGQYVGDSAGVLAEESKTNLDKLAASLPGSASQRDSSYKPEILSQSGEGKLGDHVQILLKQKDIELIVLGARSGGVIDHLLNGSDTEAVIDHVDRPVLVVPPTVELQQVKKVIFATDFNIEDFSAVRYLVNWAKLLNFQLEIAHVSLSEEKEGTQAGAEIAFRKEMNRLPYHDVIYHDIRGKNVIQQLNNLCQESGAGMLAMVHLHHDFFTRVFGQSTAHKALADQRFALLIFPSNFVEDKVVLTD